MQRYDRARARNERMELGQKSNKRGFWCRMCGLRGRRIIKRGHKARTSFFHFTIAFPTLSFTIVRNRFIKRSHPERVMLLYTLSLRVHVILNFDSKYSRDGR